MKIDLSDIQKAHEVVKSVIQHTEFNYSHSASQMLGSDIYFKYENMQRTGSFKIRGAFNKISGLTKEEKSRGIIASSAGNHAQGVALSAKIAGVKSVIVMPENASLNKQIATKGYGAELILHGENYDEAYAYARKLSEEKNMVYVHAYEDPAIIAGQGTIGLEMLSAVPDLNTVVVSIGGGGVISGIACAVKNIRPSIRVIGVQTDTVPSMYNLYNKKQTNTKKSKIRTIADGIAVKNPSQVMYENFIAKYVDEIVIVSEDEIAEAIVFLLERTKTVVEGSGAAAFAAAINRGLNLGKKAGILLSGGNIDLNIISQVIQKGQIKRGRLVEISVIVDDVPGTLNNLTQIISSLNANIIEVQHNRTSAALHILETQIDFIVETKNQEHVDKIINSLKNANYKLVIN